MLHMVFMQLIAKRTAHDKFPKAASIIPKFRTAYLEVITLGVRDLKPHGFQARQRTETTRHSQHLRQCTVL